MLETAMNVPISEAKAKFAEIIRRAEAGEEVVVTRNGAAVAKIAAVRDEAGSLPRVGAFVGKGTYIAEDFDELGPEWDPYIGK
ncbi:MAG: type II toxin-antitoxin system Phd/YefM family antitoxin [Pikeienuella sp.]